MTTNRPTTYWAPSTALHRLESRHNNAPCILTDGPAELNDVALVRLADYEALQAEFEALRAENAHLRQAMQRKVTALCAASMKSRATDAELEQYLAVGIAQLEAERDALQAECEKLRKRARVTEHDCSKALRTLEGLERVAKVVSDNSDAVCEENNLLRSECEKLRKDAGGLVESLKECVGWLEWMYHPQTSDKVDKARIQRANHALAPFINKESK